MSENERKKLYYTISEVCRQTSLEPHILRYWESEIPQLRPKKNSSGNRAYKDKDIELICYIKRLLYDEKLTISGAKQRLTEERRAERQGKVRVDSDVLSEKISDDQPIHDTNQSIQTLPPSSPDQTRLSDDLIAEIREELEGILGLLIHEK